MSPRPVRWVSVLTLVLIPASLHAQQTGIVRGRVTDVATGAAVEGARVSVEGTRLGVASGANGEYLLAAVPAGRRFLVARRVGYSPARREVDVLAGQTVAADFALRAAVVELDAIVVTGSAAPIETRALGNSIGSVDGAAIVASRALTVDAALQGKVAGAQITQNSGNPGGGGVSVRLRGTSSIISGSEPLYIVDGVIVDNSSDQLIDLGARSNVQNRLADLDPNDIERIEVVRGAAAAALYGSRANNGVIQIFTRRGRLGPPRFTVDTRYTTERLARRLAINRHPTDAAGNPVTRYDYQDQIFSSGDLIESHLSVEGGDDRTAYYLSGSWNDENGLIPNSGSTRKSARFNLSQQLFPTLRLSLGGNFVNTHSEFEPNGEQTTGVITALLFTPTTYSFFPVNGIYPAAPTGSSFANPLDVVANWKAPQDVNRFVGSVRARFTPRSDLALEYTLGYDGYQMEVNQLVPRNSLLSEPTGRSTAVLRDSRIVNSDGVVTLTRRASRGIELTGSLGFNYTWQRISTTTAAATDLVPTGELVSAGAIPSAGQSRFDLVTLGFYGQQMVNWRDRLYVTGALRWDASSTFGPEERWQLFPKLSASYVLSEEPWFRESLLGRPWSTLRLRAALGYAGNQPSIANAYARFDSYGKIVNSGRIGVVNSVSLGNEALRPERQREFEFGADVGLLRDRLAIEATYYSKRVTDLLLFRPLATSTGYSNRFDNIGEMSNRGIELTARSIIVEKTWLRWATTVTYARNRNRIERLVVAPFTLGYGNRVEEGQPVGFFYGAFYQRNPDGTIKVDALGRPLSSLADTTIAIEQRRRNIGDPNPDWFGSLINEFQIGGNLRVRVQLDGSFGNDVFNFTRRILDRFGTGADAARELLPIPDPNRLPTGTMVARFGIFEEYVEDGSYVKLREVSLTYRLGDALARRFGARSAEVTLAGRNLHTWTDYTGYDPEMNLFGQRTVERGNDFATYPIPRTWTLGVRVAY